MTHQEIHNTLNRLKLYSAASYYNVDARTNFNNIVRKFRDIDYRIVVNDNGKYSIHTDTFHVDYDISATIRSPRKDGTLDNLMYSFKIENEDMLTEKQKIWAGEVSVMVVSAFQRALAFIFFARMTEESITTMSNILAQFNPSSVERTELI